MHSNNIRLWYALRIDPLRCLHLGHRFDPVAQGGGPFKFHRLRGVLHLLGKLCLNIRGFTAQKSLCISDQNRIVLRGHIADAGRAAAFDLILQTGTCAGVKLTV